MNAEGLTAEERARIDGIQSDTKTSTEFFSSEPDTEEITIRAQWFKLNFSEHEFLLSIIDRLSAENAALTAAKVELEQKLADEYAYGLTCMQAAAELGCLFTAEKRRADSAYEQLRKINQFALETQKGTAFVVLFDFAWSVRCMSSATGPAAPDGAEGEGTM
jgi:hypothetical protein